MAGDNDAFGRPADGPNVEMAGIDPRRAIDLRWTLRDIKANRIKTLPPPSDHVCQLVTMGLIEVVEDVPTITAAGLQALEH
jgi:hypothetical protein